MPSPSPFLFPAPFLSRFFPIRKTTENAGRGRGRGRGRGNRGKSALCVFFTLAALCGIARADSPIAHLKGTIRERGLRRAVAAAIVTARIGESEFTTDGDAEGRFDLAIPIAGRARVVVIAGGYRRLELDEKIDPGVALTVDYRLDPDRLARYTSVVRGEAAREEVARDRIDAEEIGKLPGSRGDALRAISNFPGVARAPLDTGQLVVWGSAPADTSVYVDGHYIPQLFHFGGLTSVFNSELLSGMDFLPGNFPVKYGRAIGGVVDLYPRAGARDGFHGYAKIDFIDASLMLEGPLGAGSFAIAARRSTIDFVLPIAGKFTSLPTFTVAPSYWDYQAVLDYPLLGGHLRVLLFGASDDTALLIGDSPDADPALAGDFDTHLWFHTLSAWWRRDIGRVSVIASTSFGPQHQDLHFGSDVNYTLDVFEIDARLETRVRLGKRMLWRAGIDIADDDYSVSITAPTYIATESEVQQPISVTGVVTKSEGSWQLNPAVWTDLLLPIGNRLDITPGMRLDYFSGQRWTFDPRITARFRIATKSFLIGGVGLFHEPAQAPYADPVLGNPLLRPEQALHFSFGVDTSPFAQIPQLHIRLVGFYKQLWDLPAPSSALVQQNNQVIVEKYADTGIGRVYGAELLIRQDLSKYVFGWLAYTLLKSERQDHPGDPWRPFQYDQTHILALILSTHLPKDIDVGLRFRYVTGNPDTPYTGGIFFADHDVYVGVPGAPYSTRLPSFISLDLRVDKRFRFASWLLDIYLDISNVTNHANGEGTAWSFDYSRSATVTGLPILPSLGVKAAF